MLEQKYISGTGAVNIARSVEQSVAAGRLRPGDLLPSVRLLSGQLQVSSATVAAAYRLLRDRGVVVADRRRGTRIRPAAPLATPPPFPLPRGVRDLASGNPDPALLPDLAAALRATRAGQRLYGGSLNDPDLVALARRQFAADKIPSRAVAVVSGALDGIERVLREHLHPGDRVVVEDPCFTGIADLLAALALVPIPVAVDDEGLVSSRLAAALRRNPAAVIVTPRAQNPTGAAFSPGRARELRAVLRGKEVLLIEDDHAGAIAGAPYHTLVTPATAKWAVVRSVSKSLGPDLRLALMAGDPSTISRVEGRQNLGIRWVSHILQRVVLRLLRDTRTRRRLARASRVYAHRRRAAIEALAAEGIEAHGSSGLNIWIPVADEGRAITGLQRRGWAVNAGERYRLETPAAIRVTITTLDDRDAVRFAADLAAIVEPSMRASVA
jgi:DNA-binding transcriptional MocR family regulator